MLVGLDFLNKGRSGIAETGSPHLVTSMWKRRGLRLLDFRRLATEGKFALALIYPANIVRDVERRWKRRPHRPVAALPRNDDKAGNERCPGGNGLQSSGISGDHKRVVELKPHSSAAARETA